jgi:hypothetical protein
LAPEITDVSVADEFSNILHWTDFNKLRINKAKTKQLIFRRPNIHLAQLPVYLPNIVECIKLLEVFVNSTFNQLQHVTCITGTANQRLYLLLKILKQNGLNVKSLDCIFSAIVISRIT